MKGTIRITILLLACIAFVGWMGGNAIDECVEGGTSIDNCFAIHNP